MPAPPTYTPMGERPWETERKGLSLIQSPTCIYYELGAFMDITFCCYILKEEDQFGQVKCFAQCSTASDKAKDNF